MFIWLAKEPKSGGDRLDCLTQLFLVAPHLVLKLINEEGFRAIARTKNMRASKPSNEIKNQVADKNLLWQSMSSARESHYSDRRFFCNTFFETFAL